MKRIFKYIALALLVSAMSAIVANAQDGRRREVKSLDFSAMSDDELDELMKDRTYREIYAKSGGRPNDLVTETFIHTVTRPGKPDSVWVKTNYDLLVYANCIQISIGVGGTMDFVQNTPWKGGGEYFIGVGYVTRRLGVEITGGMELVGTKDRRPGYVGAFGKLYGTPVRSNGLLDVNRFDIGCLIGVQASQASMLNEYVSDTGLQWGDIFNSDVEALFTVGGFLRYEHRIFHTGWSVGVEAGVKTFRFNENVSIYSDNPETGEVYLDIDEMFKNIHFSPYLQFRVTKNLTLRKTNYKD